MKPPALLLIIFLEVWIGNSAEDDDRLTLVDDGPSEELDALTLAPEQLQLSFDVDNAPVKLNLVKNSHVNPTAPVIVGKRGRLDRWTDRSNQTVGYYVDYAMQASIMITPIVAGRGRLHRKFVGSFRLEERDYLLEPAAAGGHRGGGGRRKRELGDSYRTYRIRLVNYDPPKFNYDAKLRDVLNSTFRLPPDMTLTNTREERSPHKYGVELLMVLDHAIYQRWWYQSKQKDSALREQETINNIRYYYSHVVNGVDLRFSSIDDPYFSIYVRLSGFYIAATPEDSAWTERGKVDFEDYDHPFVDANTALDEFEKWLNETDTKLPQFDQATLFTGLYLSGKKLDPKYPPRKIGGLADIKGVCTFYKASINSDGGLYAATMTAAHELGHSLGALHDGRQNECTSSDQYIMATSPGVLKNATFENPYKFSPCSIRYLREHIQLMNVNGANCLANNAEGEPRSDLEPGQRFNLEDQCKYIYGLDSFYCSGHQNDVRVCRVLECYDPRRQQCTTTLELRAAVGTSCGKSKWCQKGLCIHDEKAPVVKEFCRNGDYKGSFYDGRKCQEVVKQSPWQCYEQLYSDSCCQSCQIIKTSSETDTDCPYGDRASWCSTLKSRQCYTNEQTCCDICSRFKRETKGCEYGDYIKNCINKDCSDPYYQQKCCQTCKDYTTTTTIASTRTVSTTVTTARPTTVPECKDSASWCVKIFHGHCYNNINKDTCCRSCQKGFIGKQGCEFGDHNSWCQEMKSYHCYNDKVRPKCCQTCPRRYTNIAGCQYGDHYDRCKDIQPDECNDGYNKRVCCQACHDIKNAARGK